MAAVDYFLKLDGIEGESADLTHKGEIDVLSFSWAEAQAPSGWKIKMIQYQYQPAPVRAQSIRATTARIRGTRLNSPPPRSPAMSPHTTTSLPFGIYGLTFRLW